MDWERFHYICRRTLHEIGERESVNDCIERIEKSTACDLYGSSGRADSISQNLLMGIKNKSDRSEAINALEIYSAMDLSNLLTESIHFRRVVIYLALVLSVFIGVSGIYQYVVAPAFLETFESFNMTTPTELVFFQDYWIYFVVAIVIVMSLSLYIGQTLKNIMAFKVNRLNTFAVQFFVPRKIKYSYASIIEAIFYPVSMTPSQTENQIGNIDEHLKDIEQTGMDLAIEIASIIKLERNKLVDKSEKFMNILSAIIAISVIYMVLSFLASAYSPIFSLGELM